MKSPFLYLSFFLLLGIIFSYYIDINTIFLLILLFISLFINFIGKKENKFKSLNLFFSIFLLGIILTNLKTIDSQLLEYKDALVEITGIVDEIKIIEENESRYIVRVTNICHDGNNKKVSEKIQLKILGEKTLSIGEELLFKGVLREPLPNTNPKLYNHRLKLLTEGIYTSTTIKDYSIIHVVKGNLDFIDRMKYKFIESVEEIFDSYLTEKNSSLMKAVILGKSSYLTEDNIEKFRHLGLAHILAVSGLHIGLITNILTGLLGYLGINKKLNIGITLSGIWMYAYIIGGPPSVIRANIMFTILFLSKVFWQAYESINALFFALFIMLIINPYWAFSIGFQLSFIATFFILYLTPKIKIIFYPSDSQLIKSLKSILSVQIGLLPIQAYYFNRVPIISMVANLLIVPLFSIGLILGLLLLFFSYLIEPIAYFIGIVINFLLDIQFYIINILECFPYIDLKVPSPSIMGILCYYILLFIGMGIIKISNIDKKISKVIIFYLLFLILVNFLTMYFDQSIEIRFIDVGQGDSILIKTQGGNYLIDTGGDLFGNFDVGENILFPYLEKEGIFKLKGVFITHYDIDHCKSLPYLMDNMKIEKIYIGHEKLDNDLYEEINNKAKEKNIPIILLKRGHKLKLDDNTDMIVLGPHEQLLKTSETSNENDLSLILMLNYYDKNILFTGDIEDKGERTLINNATPKAYFLKVPHHGSKTSSSMEFLDKVSPEAAFISVGRNNMFGHPHEEVIKRYNNRNIQLYRTDELGLITLTFNKEKYQVYSFLKEKLNIMYAVKYFYPYIFYIIISYMLIKYYIILEKEMKIIEL
ncbi:competence protein ComEC [Keratinibaculum paraultunense]|uniref:Competence protein ComEC n=1 Tax=Keratinibaculum paraultunense TaxID=1278232 RepID=A0A4R3KYC8_9FIRM|nr:DNA internalization-related competence protein ComEC/Rec2 [Keratinibaculum paraultunense]QQY80450.1 DNA internalization-related competence protein ComEC/Rec2 [Keratinibaculum paraultunense]TCS91168.1 competence protein ComEC [Keratinibaculum paraultunense]